MILVTKLFESMKCFLKEKFRETNLRYKSDCKEKQCGVYEILVSL